MTNPKSGPTFKNYWALNSPLYEGHFYVRFIGLYIYKYIIYGTISISILKGLASV